MNIFWLDTNLQKCAQYHCDKHVVKMPLEYVQMLSCVASEHGIPTTYKNTHENHPCTKWARLHGGNYTLLYDLAVELGKEYTYRYGKKHKSISTLEAELPRVLNPDEVPIRSPLYNGTSFKGPNPNINLVDRYRMFYIRDKAHILYWNGKINGREEPPFMGDRFYYQQIEATGNCPGNTKNKTNPPKPKKPTKAELAEELRCSALEKLVVADLQKLQMGIDRLPASIEVPEGRLKAPYLKLCNQIHSEVDWKKLTVSDLITVINWAAG